MPLRPETRIRRMLDYFDKETDRMDREIGWGNLRALSGYYWKALELISMDVFNRWGQINWKFVSQKTIRRRQKQFIRPDGTRSHVPRGRPKTLVDTGRLRASLTRRTGDSIRTEYDLGFGTRVPYSRIHMTGGTSHVLDPDTYRMKLIHIPKRWHKPRMILELYRDPKHIKIMEDMMKIFDIDVVDRHELFRIRKLLEEMGRRWQL